MELENETLLLHDLKGVNRDKNSQIVWICTGFIDKESNNVV